MKQESLKKTSYLSWAEKVIVQEGTQDFLEIEKAYADGFVATRLGKGKFQQTRSVRIDLQKFFLTSENRRILKKTEPLTLQTVTLPIPAMDYDWHIHKIGSDFYTKKFGDNVFSANKIKSILTDATASSFTTLFKYNLATENQVATEQKAQTDIGTIGYCITLETPNIIHYSYPFYKLNEAIAGTEAKTNAEAKAVAETEAEAQNLLNVPKDMGMGMMVRAVEYAKASGKKYIYLGSLQRPGDIYKLQFEGIEWFNGKNWSSDLEEAKSILKASEKLINQEHA